MLQYLLVKSSRSLQKRMAFIMWHLPHIHPASNGLAEKAVRTFKEFMKVTIDTRVARFLLQYRITPHSTTGISPAEMLMGRCPRTCLDLALPDIHSKVVQKQQSQKDKHDRQARHRTLQMGDRVQIHQFPTGNSWLPGTLANESGPLSFKIN